jgi:hypothetical protein
MRRPFGGGATKTEGRSGLHEAGDGFGCFVELGGRFIATGSNGVGDAVLQVIVEERQADLLKCPSGSRNLIEDVDAVAVVVDHLGDAPNLSFDASESLGEVGFAAVVTVMVRVPVVLVMR